MIRLDELAHAIMHETGVSVEEAQETALMLLNIFGFDNRIVDNVLDNSERSLMRTLEDAHLIRTEREDCCLEDGRDWHMHFWVLNHDAIKSATGKLEAGGTDGGTVFLYSRIPEEAWIRSGAGATV